MEHTRLVNRRSGSNWITKCSCGRVWRSARWHCEESFNEHLPDIEEPETYPRWYDNDSYARYQGDDMGARGETC